MSELETTLHKFGLQKYRDAFIMEGIAVEAVQLSDMSRLGISNMEDCKKFYRLVTHEKEKLHRSIFGGSGVVPSRPRSERRTGLSSPFQRYMKPRYVSSAPTLPRQPSKDLTRTTPVNRYKEEEIHRRKLRPPRDKNPSNGSLTLISTLYPESSKDSLKWSDGVPDAQSAGLRRADPVSGSNARHLVPSPSPQLVNTSPSVPLLSRIKSTHSVESPESSMSIPRSGQRVTRNYSEEGFESDTSILVDSIDCEDFKRSVDRAKWHSDQKNELSLPMVDNDMRIKVCVRKRPLGKREIRKNEEDVVGTETDTVCTVSEQKVSVHMKPYIQKHNFTFDHVFGDPSTNLQVYKETAQPLVRHVLGGKMATCFAYGQTGAGKTHTMMGKPGKLPGLYLLGCRDLFQLLLDLKMSRKMQVVLSYFEIYCGRLYDLLNGRKLLHAREDGKGVVHIRGLEYVFVDNADQVMSTIEKGDLARVTGQTGANDMSSRSHAVVQLELREKDGSKVKNFRFGRLTFVDLAGSERASDTLDDDKQRRKEGADINTSLLALKECIRGLDLDAEHIPFRQSKLTMVLKDSFQGDSRTCMIACVAPGHGSCDHTINTLRYAYRVKELGSSKDLPTVDVSEQQGADVPSQQRRRKSKQNKNPVKRPPWVSSVSLDPTEEEVEAARAERLQAIQNDRIQNVNNNESVNKVRRKRSVPTHHKHVSQNANSSDVFEDPSSYITYLGTNTEAADSNNIGKHTSRNNIAENIARPPSRRKRSLPRRPSNASSSGICDVNNHQSINHVDDNDQSRKLDTSLQPPTASTPTNSSSKTPRKKWGRPRDLKISPTVGTIDSIDWGRDGRPNNPDWVQLTESVRVTPHSNPHDSHSYGFASPEVDIVSPEAKQAKEVAASLVASLRNKPGTPAEAPKHMSRVERARLEALAAFGGMTLGDVARTTRTQSSSVKPVMTMKDWEALKSPRM
eukprot:m.38830 g.38830  ORF g.38830 m.38830 type:complete len:961 (-) comp9479_c1_seq1:70-2952(-)